MKRFIKYNLLLILSLVAFGLVLVGVFWYRQMSTNEVIQTMPQEQPEESFIPESAKLTLLDSKASLGENFSTTSFVWESELGVEEVGRLFNDHFTANGWTKVAETDFSKTFSKNGQKALLGIAGGDRVIVSLTVRETK